MIENRVETKQEFKNRKQKFVLSLINDNEVNFFRNLTRTFERGIKIQPRKINVNGYLKFGTAQKLEGNGLGVKDGKIAECRIAEWQIASIAFHLFLFLLFLFLFLSAQLCLSHCLPSLPLPLLLCLSSIFLLIASCALLIFHPSRSHFFYTISKMNGIW